MNNKFQIHIQKYYLEIISNIFSYIFQDGKDAPLYFKRNSMDSKIKYKLWEDKYTQSY